MLISSQILSLISSVRAVYASRNMGSHDTAPRLIHLESVHSWRNSPSLSRGQDHSRGHHFQFPCSLRGRTRGRRKSFSLVSWSHPRWMPTHFFFREIKGNYGLKGCDTQQAILFPVKINVFLLFSPGPKRMAFRFEWGSFTPNYFSMTNITDGTRKGDLVGGVGCQPPNTFKPTIKWAFSAAVEDYSNYSQLVKLFW